jgi:hypothetical protein
LAEFNPLTVPFKALVCGCYQSDFSVYLNFKLDFSALEVAGHLILLCYPVL